MLFLCYDERDPKGHTAKGENGHVEMDAVRTQHDEYSAVRTSESSLRTLQTDRLACVEPFFQIKLEKRFLHPPVRFGQVDFFVFL